jgi:trimethylamine---corrinoid protein Co-methyltransferase
MSSSRLQLRILSEESALEIEETAYRLLDEVGIALDHDRAVEMLHGMGSRVDAGRVFIPPDVVRQALEGVSPHRTLYRFDGSPAGVLGDGQVRFHSGGGVPFIFDLETGERRRPTLEDVAQATRLLDALPNVDLIIPLVGPHDVLPELLTVASTHVLLRHTRKPTWSAPIDKAEHVPYVVEMAAACCGGTEAFRARPPMCLCASPVSPLIFTHDVAGAIVAIAELGAPFLSLPAPSLGATGPVTLAGSMAQQHAEVLASLVIAAAARPGTPVMYCSRISGIDPHTAISIWGGPEVGLSSGIAAHLAHRLDLACDSYGFCTSASHLDAQFGYERLANALVAALAGVDILSGVGSTENVMTAGLEIAVVDDELAGLVKHIVAGVEVNDTTLAYDVMAEVIRGDGAYVGALHTARQMRKGALWIPGISARGADAPPVVERARARVREILAGHESEPLPEDIGRHLDEIMSRARRELAGVD